MPEQFNKLPLGLLFRSMREEKGLLIRQVAAVTELDQAIISRIENCERIPTKEQVLKLAGLYNLDVKETMSAWLAEKMVRDYGDEPFVTDALREAHDWVVRYNLATKPDLSDSNSWLSFKQASEIWENRDPKRKPGRKSNKPKK